MALTSSEIASKEFLVGLRGYDKDEVRAFEIPAATQQKTEQLLQISRRLTGI